MSVSSLQHFSSIEAVDLPPVFSLHLAVGMFDGLHRGHQAVIGRAVEAARQHGGLSAVLSFWPHPSHLLRPKEATRMLMQPEEKARVLAQLGVDALITHPFTRDFAALESLHFLPYLRDHLPGLKALYVGDNFRYGKRRAGFVESLRFQSILRGPEIVALPRLNFEGEPISSTRIRAAIRAGQIEHANDMLGYPYFGQGVVEAGRELGRTIGSPTLNIHWQPELQPRYGVYAVEISETSDTRAVDGPGRSGGAGAGGLGRRVGSTRPGIANFGLRPTVGTQSIPQLEVFVLADCPWDRGDDLVVELRHFIRPEQKFPGLDALKAQIAADTATAREWLAAHSRD